MASRVRKTKDNHFKIIVRKSQKWDRQFRHMPLLKGLERNLPQMKSDVMRKLQLILTKFESFPIQSQTEVKNGNRNIEKRQLQVNYAPNRI